MPLIEAVRRHAAEHAGAAPRRSDPAAHALRATFGHCFNPVSFYYCYRPDGETLDSIVAEITNTPWKERHSYVLPPRRRRAMARRTAWTVRQGFPRLALPADAARYDWRFSHRASPSRAHGRGHDAGDLRRHPGAGARAPWRVALPARCCAIR
jgi:DUF1365 family protein